MKKQILYIIIALIFPCLIQTIQAGHEGFDSGTPERARAKRIYYGQEPQNLIQVTPAPQEIEYTSKKPQRYESFSAYALANPQKRKQMLEEERQKAHTLSSIRKLNVKEKQLDIQRQPLEEKRRKRRLFDE